MQKVILSGAFIALSVLCVNASASVKNISDKPDYFFANSLIFTSCSTFNSLKFYCKKNEEVVCATDKNYGDAGLIPKDANYICECEMANV